MADPPLTSLCTICHIAPPIYRCPRCGVRTCSQLCVKKHKTWAECSGERDKTAYKPAREIRTPAGIDHDYNFIKRIELSRERAEKLIVEDKQLMDEEDIRPATFSQIQNTLGPDGVRRRVFVTRVLRTPKKNTYSYGLLLRRLRRNNTSVLRVPRGMERQRQNNTSWNSKTQSINWQIEWVVFQESGDIKGRRILDKALETTPLYKAFAPRLRDDEANKSDRRKRQRLEFKHRNPWSSTWKEGWSCLQDPYNGTWSKVRDSHIDAWPGALEDVCKRNYAFFLAEPRTGASPRVLMSLDSSITLAEALRGKMVSEFPTLYVFEKSLKIPQEFHVDPTKSAPEKTTGPHKREKSTQVAGKKDCPPRKKRRVEQELEEGEVLSDKEMMEEMGVSRDYHHVQDDFSNEDESEGGEDGLEAKEAISEVILGEGDTDDETSSSGSDTDSEAEINETLLHTLVRHSESTQQHKDVPS
jgi:hypothetical protein